MGRVQNTIAVYERLRKRKYKISVENGIEFILSFDKKYYHHLVGYHYLTDISHIAEPPHGKERFYRQIKNNKIQEDEIIRSQLFKAIRERIDFFEYIEDIVDASECKIIVEFNPQKAKSDIEAKFFLFKRNGNPLMKEPITYYTLFIGYDALKDLYYPATYVVEHSNKYIADQEVLNCKIELIDDK